MKKNCLYCSKEYIRNPKYSQKQWDRSKYCSSVCSGKVIGYSRSVDYMRLIATGVKQSQATKQKRGIYRRGKEHPLFKGDISDDGQGYLRYNSTKVRVHRKVLEDKVGKIPPNLVVHHIDGNKQNNSLKNLQLLTRSEHFKLHKIERESQNVA